MIFKVLAGVLALALVFAFLAPPVFKLKETDLGIVVLIGIVLILVDLWQSLQSKDD